MFFIYLGSAATALANESSASLFTSPRVRPRLPIGKPKILLAIGGQAPKAIRSVEGYDFKEDKWVNISEMPNRRCRCGVAVVKGKSFIKTFLADVDRLKGYKSSNVI